MEGAWAQYASSSLTLRDFFISPLPHSVLTFQIPQTDTPCQRVLVVPLTSTLEELYNVICIAFGWHSLVSSEDYFVHPMEGVFGSAPKSTKPTTRRSAQKQQTTANSESKSIKVFHYVCHFILVYDERFLSHYFNIVQNK